MKKIIKIGIVLGLLLLAISSVFAITIGTKITQTQLDNQDINMFELNPKFEKENGFIKHQRETTPRNDFEVFFVNITSLDSTGKGDYIVVSKQIPIVIDRDNYKEIVANRGMEEAKKLLRFELQTEKARIEYSEKAKIEEYQTKVEPKIDDLFKDIELD